MMSHARVIRRPVLFLNHARIAVNMFRPDGESVSVRMRAFASGRGDWRGHRRRRLDSIATLAIRIGRWDDFAASV
jgi:hypothetical protein